MCGVFFFVLVTSSPPRRALSSQYPPAGPIRSELTHNWFTSSQSLWGSPAASCCRSQPSCGSERAARNTKGTIWNSAHEVKKKCLLSLLTKRNSGVFAASAPRLDYCCDTVCSPRVSRDNTVTSLRGRLRSPQSRFQKAARDILSGGVWS